MIFAGQTRTEMQPGGFGIAFLQRRHHHRRALPPGRLGLVMGGPGERPQAPDSDQRDDRNQDDVPGKPSRQPVAPLRHQRDLGRADRSRIGRTWRIRRRRAGCCTGQIDRRIRGFPGGESRDIATLRDDDAECVALAASQIVVVQRTPQPAGFDPDDRIDLRVEAHLAIENRRGDAVALDAVSPPGERLFDDVPEKAAVPIGGGKIRAGENAFERLADRPDRQDR